MGNIAGVILAGGKSSRMGTDKALLTLGERKIIERVVDNITDVFKQIVIVSNQAEKYLYLGVPVVKDVIPGFGPLSGIHAGLIHTKEEYVFITGCDMPFISKNLIKYMIKKINKNKYDVIIPKIGRFMEPLFAIYSKQCIKPIEKNLSLGKLRIIDFLPEIQVGYVLQEEIKIYANTEKVFLNVNTPKDFEQAKDLISNDKAW